MASVERIARNIVVAEGGNVFEDYYAFYNDGKWIVSVGKKIAATLGKMLGGMDAYQENLPKLEEYAGYVDDVKLDALNTAQAAKEFKKHVSSIKEAHEAWDNASEGEKVGKYDVYVDAVSLAKKYADAFVRSCVSTIRNRYVEDEDNVRNLLDVIHDAGSSVLVVGETSVK